MEEGCLSLPGIQVPIKRPQRILVSYLDQDNNRIEREYDGLLARVISHETDHLRGKLIIDYVGGFPDLKKRFLQLRHLHKQRSEVVWRQKFLNPTVGRCQPLHSEDWQKFGVHFLVGFHSMRENLF